MSGEIELIERYQAPLFVRRLCPLATRCHSLGYSITTELWLFVVICDSAAN